MGEWQILNYRSAFEKKYGILTDGFEWRFYYGEIADETYYKFTLQQMFADPGRFRTFWDEYVKPGNYYLAFFQQVGQQSFAFHDEPEKRRRASAMSFPICEGTAPSLGVRYIRANCVPTSTTGTSSRGTRS